MTTARTTKGCIAIALLAFGCGSEATKTAPDDSFEGLAGFEEKADQFSGKMTLVGSLDYGQTSADVRYHNPPQYRAFKFGGAKGDKIQIDVSSANGDSVAWLLDNSFKVIAKNDDANDSTLDSHIAATLPGNTNPAIITYYIIFREYSKLDATFKVKLTGPAACLQMALCIQGSHWDNVQCKCVPNQCVDTQFCIQGTHWDSVQCKCVSDNQFCGGIAGIRCPAGQHCIDNPNDSCDPARGGADCGGICVTDTTIHCGGIAARPCPSGQRCVDDPSDNCDPSRGGADCGGICVGQCVQNAFCISTSHWDPTACACVPNAPAGCGTGPACRAGTSCQPCRTTTGVRSVCLPTGAVC